MGCNSLVCDCRLWRVKDDAYGDEMVELIVGIAS